MARSPGAQIRRRFIVELGLVLLVGAGALASSVASSRSLNAIAERAEPFAAATAAIERSILAAQGGLLRYLSELAEDTASGVDHISELERQLSRARGAAPSPEALKALDEIGKGAERFRKVLQLMPRSAGPSRDWSRVQEYSQAAIDLGKSVEERAARLAAEARAEIQRQSHGSLRAATAATVLSAAVIAAIALSALVLRGRWIRLQEQLLGL